MPDSASYWFAGNWHHRQQDILWAVAGSVSRAADDKNKVNFYDGMVRVVDPIGKEFVKYAPKDYLAHVAEHVEPWSYIKSHCSNN